MQAQTRPTFGRRNPLLNAALAICLLVAALLGAATLRDSIELPTFGIGSTTNDPRVAAPAAVQSYSFRDANLYHPGFNSQKVSRSAAEFAFLDANLIVPGADAVARPAIESSFLEMNLIMPTYENRPLIRALEETAFVEMNTILHPGEDSQIEVAPNQPS